MSCPMPQNRLLASLPAADLDRLRPTPDDRSHGSASAPRVYAAGGPIDHVYFPQSGVVSILVVLDVRGDERGQRRRVRGDARGAGVARGRYQPAPRVLPGARRVPGGWPAAGVQGRVEAGPGRSYRSSSGTRRRSSSRSPNRPRVTTTTPVEARCAKWLLMTRDRVDAPEFPDHPGVPGDHARGPPADRHARPPGQLQDGRVCRPTTAAGSWCWTGSGLEKAACECYRAVRDVLRARCCRSRPTGGNVARSLRERIAGRAGDPATAFDRACNPLTE